MAEAEPYCERCQLPQLMCIHRGAAPRSAVVSAELVAVDWERLDQLAEQAMNSNGPTFEAQWPGKCTACGDRWEAGDRVAWSADDDGLGHADCVLDG